MMNPDTLYITDSNPTCVIEELLGTGAFGEVFRVRMEDFSIKAMKRLKSQAITKEKVYLNLIEEAIIGSLLGSHPNLATINEVHLQKDQVSPSLSMIIICLSYSYWYSLIILKVVHSPNGPGNGLHPYIKVQMKLFKHDWSILAFNSH